MPGEGHDADADQRGLRELRGQIAQLERDLQAARAAERLSNSLLEAVPPVVLRISPDLEIEFVNRVLPEYRGAPLVGQSVFEFAPPDQHAAMRRALEIAKTTRTPTSFETIAEAPDGTRDWYFTTVGPILDGDELVGLTLTSTNVSRIKQAEAELHESRARLEVALDAGRVGLWRWDAVRDVVDWDNRLDAMFGLTAATSPRTRADWMGIVPADVRARMDAHIDEALRTGKYPDFELAVDTGSERRWFIVRGGPMLSPDGEVIGLMGGVLEVTSLRQLEEQIQQTQKLEAVGQLAAGIAHNFNNMLAAIVPVLEMAKRRASPPETDVVETALQSALQASELVKELMVFSSGRHETSGAKVPLDLVVRRAVELCERTFEQRVRVALGDLSAAHDVPVDGARTEHALLNLLVNARDAVESLDASRRTVTVSARALPEAEARAVHADAQGDYVEVRIDDRGDGIGESALRRVFEPFFTTKPIGKGTGLGLPTAWAAAKAQRGYLTCRSTPGVGTTFFLALPADRARAEERAAPRGPAMTSPALVLVIDDQVAVLRSTMMLLEMLGHRALGAGSGEEGVRIAREQPVDVVLLDRSMPGQPAETTLDQLRGIAPDLPIIAFSGLGDQLEGASLQLTKPVTAAELERALAQALASRTTSR